MARMRVGLIYGGRSGEHEVSILSANSVMTAIDVTKYEVVPIAITKEGKWLPGQAPQLLVESGHLEARSLGEISPESEEGIANKRGLILSGLRKKVDVIFPVLHGPFGEDGTIQGLLELADIPYVGAGVLGSATGMDKAIMKALFQQAGLPVGSYLVYLRRDLRDFERIAETVVQKLGYPCFVKPANLGSSVGISKAHDQEELWKALQLAARYDRKIVIEAMLSGREIECGILGNDVPLASVLGEIVPCAEFYDYEAKYILNDSRLIIPAELPEELVKKVQELAVQAFKAVDCAGLARVDFFVDSENGRIFINEINTMPGFTRISMYPKLWEASGIGYVDLIDRLLQLALERYEDKQQQRFS